MPLVEGTLHCIRTKEMTSAYKSYGGSLCTDTEMAVHNTARKYHAMRTINPYKIKLYIS